MLFELSSKIFWDVDWNFDLNVDLKMLTKLLFKGVQSFEGRLRWSEESHLYGGARDQIEQGRRKKMKWTKRREQKEVNEEEEQSEQAHLNGGAGDAASVQLIRLL